MKRAALMGGPGLIKEIDRVICDPMPDQKAEVFPGKPILPMMCFLVSDVIPEPAVVEWGYTEGPVSVLPPEFTAVREGFVDPFGGGGFDAVHQVGKREGAGWLDVQMNVVSGPPGAEEPSVSSLDDRGGTREQTGAPLRIEPGPSILGGPDEVHAKREMRFRQWGDPVTDGQRPH